MRRVTLALLLIACQGPPTSVPNRCVEGWPAAAPATPQPSLAGVTPGIRFRKRITRGVANAGIVATADRIALTAGARFMAYDHDGNLVFDRVPPGVERVSAPVADEAGNFYFAGAAVYSVDPAGAWRFMTPLVGNASRQVLLSPAGVVYAATNEGWLFAVDAVDGRVRFSREIGAEPLGGATLVAGAGEALIAIARVRDPSQQLLDARTGATLARWPGLGLGAFAGPTIGLVTQRQDEASGVYPWMHVTVLDACSNVRWSIPATRPQWPALLLPGDELLLVERDDVEGSPTFVSRYAPDGGRLAGPTRAAPPAAVGADGTIYGLECDSTGLEGPSRVIAYGSDLAELWRVELGPTCPLTPPTLSPDGLLVFAGFLDDATELVAVQTTSPGLAPSAWPARRHDARGTGWLR